MDRELLNLAAYVVISSYREKTLELLIKHDAMTPKYIAKHCNIRQNHISMVLKGLKDKNLVVCLNPEVRKGRLYQVTNLGREVMSLVPELKGETGGILELKRWRDSA